MEMHQASMWSTAVPIITADTTGEIAVMWAIDWQWTAFLQSRTGQSRRLASPGCFGFHSMGERHKLIMLLSTSLLLWLTTSVATSTQLPPGPLPEVSAPTSDIGPWQRPWPL